MNADLRHWLTDNKDLTPEELTERLRRTVPAEPARQTNQDVHRTLRRMTGFGPLARLLTSPEVNDICINGPGEVWVDAGGQWHRSGIELELDELNLIVERLLAHSGKRVDRLHPMADARLSDGSRINVAAAPAGLDGPLVTIRRFQPNGVRLESFGTDQQVERVRAALRDRSNIVVSGATGAGKTSLVGALMAELPQDERLVVMEDTSELPLTSDAVVRMEAQPARAELNVGISMRDLVRNALRMRPDRIVVGEVRGAEALDLLLALNTGHRGSLATCHGAGCTAVLRRLALLAQLSGEANSVAVGSLVRSGIDLVIHVERDGSHRRIGEILDVASLGEVEL